MEPAPMLWRMAAVAVASTLLARVSGLDNGLGALPPMGWNSWNLAGCNINESFFRMTVEQLAAKGFRDAGYTYVNLDDCWMSTERTSTGDLQWGPNFPSGETLGDFVHSHGFKFGMYLSAGPKTCSLRDPNNRSAMGWGSYGNEERDAAWIAKQGADYLKYDGVCGGDYNMPPLNGSFGVMDWEQVVVSKMGVALNKTGRPIWYQYGSPYTWQRHGGGYGGLQWITQNASLGGLNSFRSGFDMSDSWGLVGEQIGGTVNYNRAVRAPCVGHCPWPDADCLEIGNNLSRIDITQSQSYFSWYAIAGAPLIMSTRIDTLDDALLQILQQPEVIAINQDAAARKGMPVMSPFAAGGGGTVWGKPLASGAAAAFLLNGGGAPANVTLWFNELGLTSDSPIKVRNAVTRANVGNFVARITVELQPAESRLFRLEPEAPASLHA